MDEVKQATSSSIRMGEMSVDGDGESAAHAAGIVHRVGPVRSAAKGWWAGAYRLARFARKDGSARQVCRYGDSRVDRADGATCRQRTEIDRQDGRRRQHVFDDGRRATSACRTSNRANSCWVNWEFPLWPDTAAASRDDACRFDTANGKVVIEIVGQDPIEL